MACTHRSAAPEQMPAIAAHLCMSENFASAVMVVLLNGVRMPPGSQPISTSSYVLQRDYNTR